MIVRSQSNCGMRTADCGTPSPTLPPRGGGSGWGGIRNLHSSGDKGFTLIEIIVLIVMAGILLPAIIIPFATGVRGSVKPEMVTKAMYLAHQKMEEYMKYDYIGVPIVNQSSTPVDPINFPNYNWQWQIKLVQPDSGNGFQDSSTEGYKQIFVRVSDPEGTTYDVYSVVTDFP